jgi:hypothetical protein
MSQPHPPSASAAFTGQLATMLATTIEERDDARAQCAALQQQVAELQRRLDALAPEPAVETMDQAFASAINQTLTGEAKGNGRPARR